jgi:hypothetical protein
MKVWTLRGTLLVIAAGVSAAIVAPRLARQPAGVSTVELGASAAIDHAVEKVAENVAENSSASHPGFDTNVYPGDNAMNALKHSGEYEWVGYYLSAPCHKDSSWVGTRQRLESNGWGLAVIYVGQQTWGQRMGPAGNVATAAPAKSKKSAKSKRKRPVRTMTRRSTKPVATPGSRCSATFVNAAQGVTDARDAIAVAAREGFPKGSVVFLDVEHMETIPQPMRDYYRAWAQALLANGQYRPGIYAHTRNAAAIYDDISDLYTQAGIDGDPPFWIAGSKGFSVASLPTDVGHAFASAWQGVLDVVRTVNGVKLPIDISVSSQKSPSRGQ